jgi:hypothetical protein
VPAARKRAMVLSGGGAKGVFEADVLKACHHTGLSFDVLTGSSIGASRDTVRRARPQRAGSDIYLVFLGPKPKTAELSPGGARRMRLYEYALRSLDLQQNATLSNDTLKAETYHAQHDPGWRHGRAVDMQPGRLWLSCCLPPCLRREPYAVKRQGA